MSYKVLHSLAPTFLSSHGLNHVLLALLCIPVILALFQSLILAMLPPIMRPLYLLFPLPRMFFLFLHLNFDLSFLREAFPITDSENSINSPSQHLLSLLFYVCWRLTSVFPNKLHKCWLCSFLLTIIHSVLTVVLET